MIQTYTHICHKTCSRKIDISYDENNIITNVTFYGGCQGNTRGVSKLCLGRSLKEVHDLLIGTDCGGRGTSCPNELALGIEEILDIK